MSNVSAVTTNIPLETKAHGSEVQTSDIWLNKTT